MNKGALLAIMGLLFFSATGFAQEKSSLEKISLTNATTSRANQLPSLRGAYNQPAPLGLLDSDPFTFMDAFSWVATPPAAFLPAYALPSPLLGVPLTPLATEPRLHEVKMLPGNTYAWGEAGFLYGTSTGGGPYSREVKQGYIIGHLGNDKTQITAAFSRTDSSGHLPAVVP